MGQRHSLRPVRPRSCRGPLRYVLRLNESEAKRQRQRLEDKLAKLGGKLDRRNQKVTASSRCEPAAGLRRLKPWLARHKLTELVELRLQGRTLVVEEQAGPSVVFQHECGRYRLGRCGGDFQPYRGVNLSTFLPESA